jgi:hypothetical protein
LEISARLRTCVRLLVVGLSASGLARAHALLGEESGGDILTLVQSYILIALSVCDVTIMLSVLHFLWQNRPLYITAPG